MMTWEVGRVDTQTKLWEGREGEEWRVRGRRVQIPQGDLEWQDHLPSAWTSLGKASGP